MNKQNDGITWIFHPRFLKIAIIGAFISFLFVYFVTMPFFIRPLYESEAIVYVPLTIASQQLSQHGIGFAGEKEIDWYIQLLKSNRLADSLIKKFYHFNLNNIDTTKPGEKSIVFNRLASKIGMEKTRYGSVSIKVRDTDPEMASAIANEIVKLGEIIKEDVLRPNRQESVNFAKTLYEQKADDIKVLEQKLDSLEESPFLQKTKGSFIYEKVLETYRLELEEFIFRKNKYERGKKEFDTPLPVVYVVSEAIASHKPVYPKRWLLAISAAGIYLILLIIIEIIKRDSTN